MVMDRDSALAAALIVATAVSGVLWLPDLVAYSAVIGVSIVIVATAIVTTDGRLPVRAHPAVLVPVAVVWVILAVMVFLHPSVAALKRAPTFIAGSAVFMFVVPAVLSRTAIERAIAAVAGVAVLIAIPGVLTGRFWIGPLLFPVGGLLFDVPRVDGLFAAKAVFTSPNYLALFAVFGLLGAGRHVLAGARGWWPALAGLSALGLALTQGRAALLALAVCLMLAVAYRFGGPRLFAVGAVGVACAAAAGILVVVLAPDFWRSVGPTLSGRVDIWGATFSSIIERPLTGRGFANPRSVGVPHSAIHNSYLRLFFIGGVLGGLAYLGVAAGVLWTVVERVSAPADADVWLVLPAIAALVLHVFNGSTIFGLSPPSVLAALFIGYAQPRSARRMVALPARIRRWARRRTPTAD